MNKTNFTEQTVTWLLEQACKDKGLRGFCRIHDLDPGNVSSIINGKKPMIACVAKAVGYKPKKMYEQI